MKTCSMWSTTTTIIMLAPNDACPDDAASGELNDDVAEGVVGVAGRRRVVEREQDSGDDLEQKRERAMLPRTWCQPLEAGMSS